MQLNIFKYNVPDYIIMHTPLHCMYLGDYIASYVVSTEANSDDDPDDCNGVIITSITLLAIAIIGLVISIVINVFLVVQCKQSRCVVISIDSSYVCNYS